MLYVIAPQNSVRTAVADDSTSLPTPTYCRRLTGSALRALEETTVTTLPNGEGISQKASADTRDRIGTRRSDGRLRVLRRGPPEQDGAENVLNDTQQLALAVILRDTRKHYFYPGCGPRAATVNPPEGAVSFYNNATSL